MKINLGPEIDRGGQTIETQCEVRIEFFEGIGDRVRLILNTGEKLDVWPGRDGGFRVNYHGDNGKKTFDNGVMSFTLGFPEDAEKVDDGDSASPSAD